jgi:pectinesterase
MRYLIKVTGFLLFFCFSISLLSAKTEKITVAQDGSGQFKTVQEAFDAVMDNNTDKTIIFIKSGLYREKLVLAKSKINLSLIGENREKTILEWDDFSGRVVGKDTLATRTSYSFAIHSSDFVAENITFSNSAGEVGQAVAVMTTGDKIKFLNCRFLGNQDTFYTNGEGRVYLKNCYLEGTVDFIFGNSIAVFENCTIYCKRNAYITAASTTVGNKFGYVFINCKITAAPSVDKMYLGRPWRPFAKTVFIRCEIGKFIHPEGWHNWSKPERETTVFYAEYKNSGEGANTSKRAAWSYQLSDEEAKLYTLKAIFKANNALVPFVGEWNL